VSNVSDRQHPKPHACPPILQCRDSEAARPGPTPPLSAATRRWTPEHVVGALGAAGVGGFAAVAIRNVRRSPGRRFLFWTVDQFSAELARNQELWRLRKESAQVQSAKVFPWKPPHTLQPAPADRFLRGLHRVFRNGALSGWLPRPRGMCTRLTVSQPPLCHCHAPCRLLRVPAQSHRRRRHMQGAGPSTTSTRPSLRRSVSTTHLVAPLTCQLTGRGVLSVELTC
jgi:hypothetical protein